MNTIDIPTMHRVLRARGTRPMYNRLMIANWLISVKRPSQVVAAKQLQITRDNSSGLFVNYVATFQLAIILGIATFRLSN